MGDITDLVLEVIEHYNNRSFEKQELPEGAGTHYYYWSHNTEDTSTE